MRFSFLSLLAVSLLLSLGSPVGAQTSTFTKNLSLGSEDMQVTVLQKILNQDPDTRIATSGPGSPGNETSYFGRLTKAAVARFQEKYASDTLVPASLTKGSGFVGVYTRAKLNALSVSLSTAEKPVGAASAPLPAATSSSPSKYAVHENEKIDIYVGDRLLENVQNRIYAAMNTGIAARIASRSTATTTAPITLPSITAGEVPSVTINTPSPRSGAPGTYVSFKGNGILTKSVLYFGSSYIVRTISKGSGDTFIFIVPPIPPGHYDIVAKTGGAVSNTTSFVVTGQTNQTVHIESVAPMTVPYGGTLTITGSGFSPQGNIVVTTYQKFTSVPSSDGKTLSVVLAPKGLQEYANITTSAIPLQMSVSVENEYGFSDSTKTFTMTL